MTVAKIYFLPFFNANLNLQFFGSEWTTKKRIFHQESCCPPKPTTQKVFALSASAVFVHLASLMEPNYVINV